MPAHQATGVAIGTRALLIEGAPGSGKSSLALALIDRGARLIGDDSLMLEARDGRLLARPHPNTRRLIEVRNLGLLPLAVCAEAPVGLVVLLDPDAPRFIDQAEEVQRAGATVPLVRLWPGGLTLALKAELALAHHGLSWG